MRIEKEMFEIISCKIKKNPGRLFLPSLRLLVHSLWVKENAMNCKKNPVVRRSVGADPVIIFPANNKVGIYVLNADVVPPLKLYTGWYGLTCMPEDFPDETTIDMLESAFPEANGRNLLRLEDHIRHEFVTLVCECDRDDAGKA